MAANVICGYPFRLLYEEKDDCFNSIDEALERFKNIEKFFKNEHKTVKIAIEAIANDSRELREECGCWICYRGLSAVELLDSPKFKYDCVSFYSDLKYGKTIAPYNKTYGAQTNDFVSCFNSAIIHTNSYKYRYGDKYIHVIFKCCPDDDMVI